jgi:hypothetical protein
LAEEGKWQERMFELCKKRVKLYVQFKDQSQIKISHNLLILEEIY